MTKKENKTIKKIARKHIKFLWKESQAWSDEEMKFRVQGGMQGVADFLEDLQDHKIIY